jgi:hypothetical protein
MDQFTPEKRKTARHRVLQSGSISFHHFGAKIDRTVRNLSEAGACLVVTSPLGITNEFDLVLDRENTPRRCRVVWQSANGIGVKFR